MKILALIFASFLIAESCVTTGPHLLVRRKRLSIEPGDILEMAEESGAFQDFHRTLNSEYNKVIPSRPWRTASSAENNVSRFYDHLLDTSCTFVYLCHAYVANDMIDYYGTAAWLVETTANYDGGTASKHVGFDGGGDGLDGYYSMLSAFHDCHLDADKWLESMFFLQTVVKFHGDYPRTDLLHELRSYQRHYESYFVTEQIPHLRRLPDPYKVVLSFRDPVRALSDIRRNVTEFADMFRHRWTPFVGYFLQSNVTKHRSMIVRHVFETEKSEVNIPVLKNQKMNRRLTIGSWSCEDILEAKEYGYEKYVKSVTKSSRSESSANPPERRTQQKPLFSLSRITSAFQSTCAVKNAVKYYDLASETILLVSIREGSKVFKGVKHSAKEICAEAGTNVVDEMRTLRTRTSVLKSVFGRLVAVMLHKKRVDFRLNPHKLAFDKRVDALMELLDFRKRRRTDDPRALTAEICGGLPLALTGFKLNGKARFGDNAYKTLRFYEYYFIAPILNVDALYRFYAYDFS